MNSDLRITAQEAKVSSLRKKEEEARRERELEEAVLRGMRLMSAGHSPTADAEPSSYPQFTMGATIMRRRGRQPGAISRQWRDTLRFLYEKCPSGFGIDEVVGAAHRYDLPNVRNRDAEERMRSYLQIGYVEQSDWGYRVSESAALKYGFSRPDTTEAPTAIAEGAS
jgi:hypothetical protein